jgi:Fe-S cluster biosynthesis and repair protein YggX
MVICQDPGQTQKQVSAICFNASNALLNETIFARIAFRLQWNRWNERKTMQLIVEDAS